jgi:hypothetical protein
MMNKVQAKTLSPLAFYNALMEVMVDLLDLPSFRMYAV